MTEINWNTTGYGAIARQRVGDPGGGYGALKEGTDVALKTPVKDARLSQDENGKKVWGPENDAPSTSLLEIVLSWFFGSPSEPPKLGLKDHGQSNPQRSIAPQTNGGGDLAPLPGRTDVAPSVRGTA